MKFILWISCVTLFITPFTFIFSLLAAIKASAKDNDTKKILWGLLAAVSLVLMLIGANAVTMG